MSAPLDLAAVKEHLETVFVWDGDHEETITHARALVAEVERLRAALDKEREAIASTCDEQAALAKRDRCHAEAGTLRQIASMVRARRAAEANEPTR